jgi:glycosyltransferase involved in cell wall biosynthesis
MASRPTVFVYHGELLPYSATFIRTQAAALQSFKAGFAGLFPSRGISLDLDLDFPPVLLTKDHSVASRLKRNFFKRTGLGAQKFLHELSARSPVLLHAHFALDASIALPITEQLGIPLITTLHGYDVTIRDEVLSRSLEGRIYLKRRERLWKSAHIFSAVAITFEAAPSNADIPRKSSRRSIRGTIWLSSTCRRSREIEISLST